MQVAADVRDDLNIRARLSLELLFDRNQVAADQAEDPLGGQLPGIS
jgi:hypothetical protein